MKLFRLELLLLSENESTFEEIPEFSDVSGEAVCL
jgi:hypothetical protein